MDEIEQLLEEIKNDSNFKKTRFTANFVNDVADVFEKYGFGTTRTFLMDKKSRRDLHLQAVAILSILEKFEKIEKIKLNRSIGRYIIKTLNTLKRG